VRQVEVAPFVWHWRRGSVQGLGLLSDRLPQRLVQEGRREGQAGKRIEVGFEIRVEVGIEIVDRFEAFVEE
jgi:hypothetical protein